MNSSLSAPALAMSLDDGVELAPRDARNFLMPTAAPTSAATAPTAARASMLVLRPLVEAPWAGTGECGATRPVLAPFAPGANLPVAVADGAEGFKLCHAAQAVHAKCELRGTPLNCKDFAKSATYEGI